MILAGSFLRHRANHTREALLIAVALGVSSAFNLASLLLWVRLLSPAEFGTLTLVTTAALLLNALGFEWLRLAGARSLTDPSSPHGVSADRLSAWIYLGSLLAAALALAVGAATMAGVATPGLASGWNLAVLLLALSEMPFAAMTLVARLRISAPIYAAAMIGRSALTLGGSLILHRFVGGALAIVAATALAQLGITGLATTRDPLWRDALTRQSSRSDRADLLRLGAPLIAVSALALVAATVDRYLVAHLLGLAAAGRYAAPAELVGKTLGFAWMAINLSAYPLLVRIWERDGPAAAARALNRNLVILLGAGLPILIAFLAFPGAIAAALLGPASLPFAAQLLPWLAAAALLRLLVSFHFGVALQLARRMGLLILPPLVTLGLLLAFARPAIEANGLIGFAQLLLLAQGAGTLSAWLLARGALAPGRARPA